MNVLQYSFEIDFVPKLFIIKSIINLINVLLTISYVIDMCDEWFICKSYYFSNCVHFFYLFERKITKMKFFVNSIILGVLIKLCICAELPCDIFGSGGTPCVAAHSITRALYGSFNGALYQVRRLNDNKTQDISVAMPGGYANASAQVMNEQQYIIYMYICLLHIKKTDI